MTTKKEELEAELTRLNALRKQVKEKLKALPIEQDKLAVVKEVYRNGEDIQCKVVFEDVSNQTFNNKIERRIKPEETPDFEV